MRLTTHLNSIHVDEDFVKRIEKTCLRGGNLEIANAERDDVDNEVYLVISPIGFEPDGMGEFSAFINRSEAYILGKSLIAMAKQLKQETT